MLRVLLEPSFKVAPSLQVELLVFKYMRLKSAIRLLFAEPVTIAVKFKTNVTAKCILEIN